MYETITFVNASGQVVNAEPIGLGLIEPGAEIEVPLALCAAGRKDNGSRKPSPIEQACPALRPKDPVFAAEWAKVPSPAPVVSKIVTVTPREVAQPAGVVAARAAKAKAELEAASKTVPAKKD